MDILSYLTGLGLAAGAGGRAALVVLGLGLFHHTGYFELADPYLWIAAPPVLAALTVVAVAEIAVDLSPDLSELTDLAGYLPSFMAGFIALSAATGQVDESLLRLSASGLLGGVTGAGMRWVRNRFASVIRATSDSTVDEIHKAKSAGESTVTGGVVTLSFVWPVLALLLLGAAIAVGAWISRTRAVRRYAGE